MDRAQQAMALHLLTLLGEAPPSLSPGDVDFLRQDRVHLARLRPSGTSLTKIAYIQRSTLHARGI